jgi:multimeric flavodoxin WrbA
MVKLLGILGSPREGGNSDLLLQKVLEGARQAGAQVSSLRAADLSIGGCLECGGCDSSGECVVEDDMQQVYPQLEAADRIILATPVFFYGFPAQLKALIDRAQSAWSGRMLTKTKQQRKTHEAGSGYLIAVGATKGEKLFEGLERVARYFFDALDMDYQGGLFFRGVDEQGAILRHPDAMEQAFELGRRIAS